MTTKAQFQADLLPSSHPVMFPSAPRLVSREKSREVVAARHEIFRHLNAASLFESAPDAMMLVDRDGRIAAVNSKTEKMFGYRGEELVGESVEKLMPERFRNGHNALRPPYSTAPQSQSLGAGLELFGRHRDGHEFPVEVSSAPLETESGVLISSVIRDVSKLKQSQELQSSLEFEKLMSRLSRIVVNLPLERIDNELNDGLKGLGEVFDLDEVNITLFDCERKSRNLIHSWSRPGMLRPFTEELFNKEFPWEPSQLAHRKVCLVSTLEDVLPEAVAERQYMLSVGARSWLSIPLLVGGECFGTMSTALVHKQQKWDSQLISRIQCVGDVLAGVIARRHAEESQRESENRFRTFANTAPFLIWMSDTDKLRTFFNQPWLAFTGRTIEQETGEGWASGIHPEDLKRCVESYSAGFDARSQFTLEYRLRRYDGKYRWVIDHGTPRLDSRGLFLGYIGSCTDISDRKLSEQALAEQLKLETLLVELSAKFIDPRPERVDGQIVEGLKCICEALGLDCSALALIPAGQEDWVMTHSYAAAGLESFQATQLHLPWVTRTVRSGQYVSFARIDDLPDDAAKDKEILRVHGPKSSLTFPLSAGGAAIGALGFGMLRTEREWSVPVVECLGLAAQIIANALSRARADQDLRRACHEIEELKHRLEAENVYLREEVKLEHHHHEVVGDSEGIRRVLQAAEQVAPTDSTVLVLGETGTGKELIARTIHEHSRRKGRVMVKVNCAALPATLIESELFGREKGAFTGALTREIGRFELASGSTIFLDEVGELPIELQSKLLRVLQEGEFERLGGPKTIKVDVRVIAATSRNLLQAVREGKFRDDLFYRLNVFPITIPPLRERPDDIPPLVWHFVSQLSQRMGRSIESIQASTLDSFKSYYWPGNVRELRNVIERFLITSPGTVFRAKLPTLETAEETAQSQTFEEVERKHLLHILQMVGWRVRGEGGAAQVLGLKPTTLNSRMQKLGISRHK